MTTPRKPAASRRSPTRAAAKPVPEAPVAPVLTPVAAPAAPQPAAVQTIAPQPAHAEPVVVLATHDPEAPASAPARFLSFFQGSTPMSNVEQTLATAKEQFEKFAQRFFGGYGDFANVGRENIEALVKSSTIWAKGTEEIGKSVAALTQAQVEASLATTKALLTVTSFKQALELQNEAAKASFDKLIAEGNKITELSLKVANEAIEPLQARVNVAVEKLTKPAA